MIRLDAISKIYDTDYVLKNISWEIKHGERIGLIGSNGAGKTTQFKILTGQIEQTSGAIYKEGNPKIAYLKQEFDCSINKTVREELEGSFEDIQKVKNQLERIEKEMKLLENIENQERLNNLIHKLDTFQRKFEALGGYQLKSKVEKILPKLGFSASDADQLVGNFSGGWQMKIALGKIILQEPDLLLLDEPTNHLDLTTIRWLEQYLTSLKISIILISHDRYFLDKLCNKIVFVDQGISYTYSGNYSFFVKRKLLDYQYQQKLYLHQQK